MSVVAGTRSWIEPHADDVVGWWAEGMLVREIAERVGRPAGSMTSGFAWLRANGYELPPRPDYRCRRGLQGRFDDKIASRDGCWQWAGATSNGYGTLWIDGKTVYAHRVSLALVGVEIPAGMDVDHLCRNPRCVNPEHLEVVTHRENLLRGRGPSADAARREKCLYGHPLDGVLTRRSGHRQRYCLTCNRERRRVKR